MCDSPTVVNIHLKACKIQFHNFIYKNFKHYLDLQFTFCYCFFCCFCFNIYVRQRSKNIFGYFRSHLKSLMNHVLYYSLWLKFKCSTFMSDCQNKFDIYRRNSIRYPSKRQTTLHPLTNNRIYIIVTHLDIILQY